MPGHGAMPLDALPATRRALVMILKTGGDASADELAAELDITVSAVRQHLAVLESDGWVEHREERAGPGRPRHRYHLAPAADGLFPTSYGALTTALLAYVEERDPALVDHLFERRSADRAHGARQRLEGLAFGAQVVELARILDEDGYLASAEEQDDGSWRIVERNCAILDVARCYAQACGAELGFIREALPAAAVTRVDHLLAGATVCAYELRPRAGLGGGGAG